MISDVYFPRINGVSTSIRNFRRELGRLGCETTLIAPAYGNHEGDDEQLHRIPSRYVPVDPEDRMMRSGFISRMESSLRGRFDIIHIHTPFVAHYAGISLARKLGIPRVATYHTHFEEYLYHYLPAVPRFLMRRLARRFNRAQCGDVDAVIVPSRVMHDLLREYGIRKPVEIIPTGLDETSFQRGRGESFRDRHGVHPRRPTLVHVGRLAHEKNIDFLIRVLDFVRRSIPDVLMIIAGEGPAARHLRHLARTLKLADNVLFVGYLDRATTLLDCYAAGDIFVFSSCTETQGLVLLEAMAQGTPVVSTAALGTRDILCAGRGAIVSAPDETEFAARVVQVLRDHEMRRALGTEARAYAETWSAPEFAAKMAAFYHAVIGGRK